MRIETINVADHVGRVEALLRANWAESGFDFPLAPDFGFYARLQGDGTCIALAAFQGDEIVGYSTAFLVRHPFNPDVMVCHTDALFVAPEHRAGGAGARLVNATELVARERGASRIFWHTRHGTPLAEVLCSRPGYVPADVVVQKEL